MLFMLFYHDAKYNIPTPFYHPAGKKKPDPGGPVFHVRSTEKLLHHFHHVGTNLAGVVAHVVGKADVFHHAGSAVQRVDGAQILLAAVVEDHRNVNIRIGEAETDIPFMQVEQTIAQRLIHQHHHDGVLCNVRQFAKLAPEGGELDATLLNDHVIRLHTRRKVHAVFSLHRCVERHIGARVRVEVRPHPLHHRVTENHGVHVRAVASLHAKVRRNAFDVVASRTHGLDLRKRGRCNHCDTLV